MSGPSHVDLSTLWVPIMPETSKMGEAMEQVGKDATESFGKGSSSLGDKIHESVTKSRDKIKDVFHRTGSDANDAMAEAIKENSRKVEDAVAETGTKAKGKFQESAKGWGKVLVDAVGPDTKKLLGDKLEETVGGALEGVLGDNAKWVGKFSHTVADWGFEELKTKLGDVKEAATKTKQAFASFKDGDTIGGVSTLLTTVDKLGIGVKDLPEPLQTVIGDISDAKSTAEEFAGIFKDLPGRIGAVGSAIEDLAGPIGVAAAAAMAIWNGLPGIGGGLNEIIHSTDPSRGFIPPASQDIQQTPAAQMPLPGMPQPVSAASIPAAGLAPGVQYTATQGSLDPFAALLPPGMAPPDLSKPSPIAPIDMPDQSAPLVPHSFVAVPPRNPPPVPAVSNSVPLIQKPDGTWTSSNPAWAHLIQRESGGNPSIFNNYDSNAQAGDPSQGLFQFTRATWAAHGGLKYGRDPSKATPQQQAEIAANLIRANPSGSDWGAGMSGRESASALLSGVGPGGATSAGWWGSRSTTDDGAPMPSMPSRGGGPSSGDKIPTGAQHDPLFVSSADKSSSGSSGEGGSSGNPWESQGKQLGQGLFGGLMQEAGLDGSVFKTFSGAGNPADFGITKIGTGLLNWAAGMMGPQAKQTHNQTTSTYNVDQSFNLTQNGVQGNGETPYKAAMNSSNRTEALAAAMPGQ